MSYPIFLKHALKHMLGLAAAATAPITRRTKRPFACILVYHRVADLESVDARVDAWNVRPARFEKQIAGLAKFAEFTSLSELPRRLSAPPGAKPLVCLTFDDGFAHFRSSVLPVLRRYDVPSSLFVVTSCVGSDEPYPFDRWGKKNRSTVAPMTWRPVGWKDLEACADNGLVTIGSHSHRHLNASECDSKQLTEEAGASRAILLRKLGDGHARFYAYPYGSTRLNQVGAAYAKIVKDAGYTLGLTTDLGLADVHSDPFLLPRIEAHAFDSPSILRAKVLGSIQPYRFSDRFRSADRGA